MTVRIFAALFVGLLGLNQAPAEDHQKIKVLVVTGGHGFKREPFFQMFQDNHEITFDRAEHAADSATVYDRDDLLRYQVLVLYDMPSRITDPQKAKFLALLERGVGLVVLHHALVSYQEWPEFERIVGGRYPEEKGRNGAVTEKVGYEHDVNVPITIADPPHPVTAGLKPFSLHDEIYWGFRVASNVTPLISTTHPKSGKLLGWARKEKNSRLVYLQPGHGPEAFADPNYRRLVGQAIRWVAPAPPADGKWISLFDGQTLDGWVQRGGKAKYRVEDQQIIGSAVPNTANSFLCTTRNYTNFVLELEFKDDAGLNSGVQIRSHCYDEPTSFEWRGKTIKVGAGRVHGLQVEIDTSARAWTGGVYEEGARGWLNDLTANAAARAAFQPGAWNRLRIECRANSIKTWLNDIPAADLQDDRVASGFIALQVHGVGKNEKPLEIRFRQLRLQEL